MLPVPIIKQKETNWCAAACTECVLKYNKIDIGQCAIMDYVRYIDPWTYGDKDFCCFPSNVSPHPCNKGMALGYDYETVSVHNVLMHYATNGLVSNVTKGVLQEVSIISQLNFGQPIIAQWNYLDGSGNAHVVVICGRENGEIKFMDPGKDKILSLPYEQFKDNNEHTWDGYLVLSSPYPGHCFNCELDGDKGEEDIDCGGSSCPPCNAPPLHHLRLMIVPTAN